MKRLNWIFWTYISVTIVMIITMAVHSQDIADAFNSTFVGALAIIIIVGAMWFAVIGACCAIDGELDTTVAFVGIAIIMIPSWFTFIVVISVVILVKLIAGGEHRTEVIDFFSKKKGSEHDL